jgi:NADH-quinone oxidoreductase subunit N
MRTLDNLLAFAPELWLLLGAVIVFLLTRFRPGPWPPVVAFGALAVAFLALMTQFQSKITILDGAFLLDRYAMVVDVILLGAASLCVLLTIGDYLPGESRGAELTGFMLLATIGALLAVSAAEMVALLVALELLAFNLYMLAALARRGGEAAQAGLGYLVLGVAGSALLLYGLALLYGLTGETRLSAVGQALSGTGRSQPAVLLALCLVVVGFAGKLGLVPARWWTRRFELGVPVALLAFIVCVSTLAAFGAFTRLLWSAFSQTAVPYGAVLAVIATVAMTGGNLLALAQTSVRRLLVYSSIAQGGYALVALTDLRHGGVSAMLVLLTALAPTYLCAFAAVIAYGRAVHSDAIKDLAGMARTTPGVAIALGIGLASLVGFPLMAGFFGKFVVLQAAVEGGFAWLAVVGVANIMLGALCYLRVIRVVFIDDPVYDVPPQRLDRGLQLAMGVSAAWVVAFGLLIGPVLTAAGFGQQALSH